MAFNEATRKRAYNRLLSTIDTLEEHLSEAEKEGHLALVDAIQPYLRALYNANNVPRRNGDLNLTVNFLPK